ncbi:MAG: ATP-binding protein [Bacteroidales bacterium]|nr:ATP-binding protein [Bacteroidales bacterium]
MPETQNIEYKSSWRDEFLREICGFANAQGGTLYIGKDDNGNIVSLKNTKKLLEDLPNKITAILGIVADVNLRETEQGDYIEIVVEPQPNPVNYKGEYHYRSGSTKFAVDR